MDVYDPGLPIDVDTWLETEESVRLDLIVEHHRKSDETDPEGGWEVHSALHLLVENQIALGTENIRETQTKLIRQGLHRHDSIHAIGAVVGEDLFEMAKEKRAWDRKRYRRRLEKLTAKRWRKGKW